MCFIVPCTVTFFACTVYSIPVPVFHVRRSTKNIIYVNILLITVALLNLWIYSTVHNKLLKKYD